MTTSISQFHEGLTAKSMQPRRVIGTFDRCHRSERYDRQQMDLRAEAGRLRQAAEARPLKLPINRRVDERHHAVTVDGLGVWYTIQVSPHGRIWEAVFEREDRAPTDDEIRPWLTALLPEATFVEAPAIPGSGTRRFDAFERSPEPEAPLA